MLFKSTFFCSTRHLSQIFFQGYRMLSKIEDHKIQQKTLTASKELAIITDLIPTPSRFKTSEESIALAELDKQLDTVFGKRYVSTIPKQLTKEEELEFHQQAIEKLTGNIDIQLKSRMAEALFKQQGSFAEEQIRIFNSPKSSEEVATLLGIEALRDKCFDDLEKSLLGQESTNPDDSL